MCVNAPREGVCGSKEREGEGECECECECECEGECEGEEVTHASISPLDKFKA